MSSHNLAEVQRVCTRVGVIKAGKMVAVEGVKDLMRKQLYMVTATFAKPIDPKVFAMDGVEITHSQENHITMTIRGDVSPVLKKLSSMDVLDVEMKHGDLEDVFLEFYK